MSENSGPDAGEPRSTARRWLRIAAIVGSLIVGIAVGALLHAAFSPAGPGAAASPGPDAEAGAAEETQPAAVWTCSMHPEVRRSKPGLCPKCGMKLIPVRQVGEHASTAPRELKTTEAAKALMDIEVVPVQRRFATAEIRMVGKVDYDETRLAYISAWVPGRLDRLYVDYTGVPVRKGDHLVYIYSPELLSAQSELIQAIAAVKELQRSNVGIVRETAELTVQAAREKLRLLGLKGEQIAEVEKTSKPSDHLTIYSPAAGIVVHKNAQEGMYVNTGTRIYTIADLTGVWVKLDAYESDLSWLRYGQKVEFATVSYPGETFHGTISFIDPVLDSATRTVKVRVNAANADGRLKPGMFVKAIVRAQVAGGGKVMDPDLAGKWICPMHPDVIKDAPGACDICGMPLVRTESLGYVSADDSTVARPLVIPASAPLITGTRAVVYVAKPGADQPTFEGREIVLGPRAGDFYLVRSGLREGEQVVTRGSFKIDSALQILAKPSMMSPEGSVPAEGHRHGGMAPKRPPVTATRPAVSQEFRKQLGGLLDAYFAMQRALAGDQAGPAAAAAAKAADALGSVDMKLLSGEDHAAWMKQAGELGGTLSQAGQAKQIEPLRHSFALVSEQMRAVVERFGPVEGTSVYELRCPMAFNNRGATWLQPDRGVRNPYFGAAMPRCGEVVKVLQSVPPEGKGGSSP